MPTLNPYIAGNPISGDQGFFGREDVLRQVERVFSSPGQNAVVIFGQRRIGKTSVLLQLQRRLDPNRYVVVYQDLMDKATRPLGSVLAELARSIALEVGLPEPTLTFDDDGISFQRNFLPQAYAALPSPDHSLVLLFDEFDVLDILQREKLDKNLAANRLFSTLRNWMLKEPRLKLGFALGRDLKDLDTDFLATFKGAQTIRISILEREPAQQLIVFPSEQIKYTPAAIERILALTNGHPYFTQLLCQIVFDRVYRSQESLPDVDAGDIDAAVPQVFQAGNNVFEWIWEGLPPAERIIASVLADLLPDDSVTATAETILDALQSQRIRVVTREMETSPKKLVEWQILREVGVGYRFLVALLRQWIREHKPIKRVQDEIDRINPRAESFFKIGKMSFDANDLKDAIENLNRALQSNPEHLQALLLLAESYLEDGQIDKSVEKFEAAYKRDESQSRSGLMRSLLIRAEKNSEDYDKSLADYERILEIKPNDPTASDKRIEILKKHFASEYGKRNKLQISVAVLSVLFLLILSTTYYFLSTQSDTSSQSTIFKYESALRSTGTSQSVIAAAYSQTISTMAADSTAKNEALNSALNESNRIVANLTATLDAIHSRGIFSLQQAVITTIQVQDVVFSLDSSIIGVAGANSNKGILIAGKRNQVSGQFKMGEPNEGVQAYAGLDIFENGTEQTMYAVSATGISELLIDPINLKLNLKREPVPGNFDAIAIGRDKNGASVVFMRNVAERRLQSSDLKDITDRNKWKDVWLNVNRFVLEKGRYLVAFSDDGLQYSDWQSDAKFRSIKMYNYNSNDMCARYSNSPGLAIGSNNLYTWIGYVRNYQYRTGSPCSTTYSAFDFRVYAETDLTTQNPDDKSRENKMRVPYPVSYLMRESPSQPIVSDLSASPNGSWLVIGTANGEVYIVDVETKQLIQGFVSKVGRINVLKFSPDGGLLAVGGERGLELWGVPTGRKIAAETLTSTPTFTPTLPTTITRTVTPTTRP